MAYDERTAERVRGSLGPRRRLAEKKMFGGVGFLLQGNMCVGVWKEFLILRVGAANYEAALRDPCVKEFDITGRAMKGWIMVEPSGFATDADLRERIHRAVDFEDAAGQVAACFPPMYSRGSHVLARR